MRVIVYSKVRLFCEALAGWLRSSSPIDEVGSVCQVTSLICAIERQPPDIVLFDIHNDTSLDEARGIAHRKPSIPLLAIALPEVADRVIACIDAGFNGYFPRDASLDELYPTIQKTLDGECECSPHVAASLFEELRSRQRGSIEPSVGDLTKRECEVLELLGEGMCNKEIARQLDISVATVKNHLHHIFGKLQVNGRVQAVAKLKESPWLARSA